MVGPSLAAAISGLYESFGHYPLRPTTEPCLHCHDVAEERRLHARRLEELTAEDLRGFAADALMTWGNETDLKHFLPRMLEIAICDGFGWPDLEIVLGHLRRAAWRTWPSGERHAVEAILWELWRTTVHTHPSRHDIDSVVTAIGRAVDDLRPYLDAWLDEPDEAMMRQLAAFVDVNRTALLSRLRLVNAFWDADRQPQVVGWLVEGGAREALTAAFFAASGDEVAKELSDAVSVLESLEARVHRPETPLR